MAVKPELRLRKEDTELEASVVRSTVRSNLRKQKLSVAMKYLEKHPRRSRISGMTKTTLFINPFHFENYI